MPNSSNERASRFPDAVFRRISIAAINPGTRIGNRLSASELSRIRAEVLADSYKPLTVRAVRNERGHATGTYQIVLGLREFGGLLHLVDDGVIARTHEVHCVVVGTSDAT